MNKKEELRKQLLENTFKKNRRLSSMNDLESILEYQKKTIEDLKSTTLDKDIERINQEIEKDFGIKYVEKEEISKISFDEIENKLMNQYHYETITDIFSFINKSNLLEKNESSLFIYNYSNIEHVLNKISNECYKTDINIVDFSNSTSKIDVFYQDMYNCLYGDSSIICFDHIECLPIAFVQSLISLFKDKVIPLQNRYVEVQGVLKETSSQLVKGAVSELTWKNKKILLLCHTSLDKFTDKYGTPFIKSIDEIKEFKNLNDEDKKKIISNKLSEFKDRIQRQLKVDIQENLIDILKFDNVDEFLDDLFEELLEYKFEDTILLNCKNNQVYLVYNDNEIELLKQDSTNFDSIDEELQSLVGLENVKEYLTSLRSYYKSIQRRKALGKKVSDVSKHMIFTGNPGTGKTTVARILSQYLKASGILESGHLIEVTRKDLVGQYVGHTAQLTSRVISSALGGVLFIDEAYSLYRGQNDSFGLEAIDTLVKCMEDYRDNLVVILAGYEKEMNEFLTANSGLRSRFSNILEFNDYTGEQLYEIACLLAKKNDYIIDENAKDELIQLFNEKNKIEGGNGRLARNMVEKAMIQHSLRDTMDDLLIIEDFKKGNI